MQRNLWLAVIYNAIAVLSPSRAMLIAALAMSGSPLLVALNALRARGGGRPS